jgi:hypothetical protein
MSAPYRDIVVKVEPKGSDANARPYVISPAESPRRTSPGLTNAASAPVASRSASAVIVPIGRSPARFAPRLA